MMLQFKNVVSENKQFLANMIINRFGSWLIKLSACNDGLYVSLGTDTCNGVYMINNRQDVEKVYNDFQSQVVKSERFYMDSEILKAYLENNFKDENLTISDMREVVEFTNKQGIDLTYQYEILGVMDNFRLTQKSIIAYDSMDNKVIFNSHSNKNYTFYKSALMVSKL